MPMSTPGTSDSVHKDHVENLHMYNAFLNQQKKACKVVCEVVSNISLKFNNFLQGIRGKYDREVVGPVFQTVVSSLIFHSI